MAEQHTHVEDIHADKVVVAPLQQNFGASGDSVRGWTEALLRGPLEQADQTRRAQDAERAATEERHEAAADGFLAVAAALSDNDFEPAANTYRSRAADAYAKAGQKGRAFDLYMALARGSLNDGDMTAVVHARQARGLASPESAWEADALLARANWPEQEEGDVEALRRAWERTDGQSSEPEWAAALVELLLLNGEREPALETARDVSDRLPLAPGPRLQLELDLLDLMESSRDGETSERWQRLLAWAQNPQLPVEVTAMVPQRRGVALARQGDRDAARSAFLQATQAWTRDPRFNDQAAQAFFSATSASFALGDFSSAFDDALPLARSLRGAEKTTTTHTERLELRGLQALLEGKHPNALRLLATAHNLARRAGNFNDFLQVTEELGDLLLESKRPLLALESYMQAGASKKTKEIGQQLSVDDVLGALPLDGAPWERIAAWAAVAGAGRTVSDEGAATVAEAALAELEREPPSGFPPNASFHAVEALAGVVCAIPTELLGRSLDALRERLRLGVGDPRRLADPFVLISLVERAEEIEILVDAMLNSNVPPAIPAHALSPLLKERPDLQERLITAAKKGDRAALEFVDFAGLLEKDEQMVTRAREEVRAAVGTEPRQVTEDNGVRTVSYGMGMSLAPIGMLARHCEESDRRSLAEKLLGILQDSDPQLPIMTRVSAVEGLHNLAPALPGDLADDVAEALLARAKRDDEPSELDRVGVDDPLARFTVNMAPPGALQTAALEALAMVAKHHPTATLKLMDAVIVAMRSGRDQLLAAALHALALNPELGIPGFEAQHLLAHQNEAIRIAALDLLSRDSSAGLRYAALLVHDPSPRVRFQLVGIAAEAEGGEELLHTLSRDPDSYTRAMARARLGE